MQVSKPISNRKPPVAVSYDSRGTRTQKAFADPYEARRFYCAKLRQGKNPKVEAIVSSSS